MFRVIQADTISGMMIAGYLFESYFSLKGSIILVDWQNAKITELFKKTIEVHSYAVIVRSVLFCSVRKLSHAEIHVEIGGNKALVNVESFSVEIERDPFRISYYGESFGYSSFSYFN